MSQLEERILEPFAPFSESFRPIPGLVRNWNFCSAPASHGDRYRAAKTLVKQWHRAPEWSPIKPLVKKSSWTVYFLYSPDGLLTSAHRFTLSRLRDSGVNLLVVCATTDISLIPQDLNKYADSLFWKALPGYDFSAYTIALREIGQHSTGADVTVLNDSIFGPFSDIKSCVEQSPWDLTGFTASSQLSHHIQSYAFCLKSVDSFRMARLAPVFFPFGALSEPNAVVNLQELRLARVAARSMKVGAFWFGDVKEVVDPILTRPLELIENGFPFIKRSLLGKHQRFQDPEMIRSALRARGHPLDNSRD